MKSYDEDASYFFAGWQDERGNYHDIQNDSDAVTFRGDNATIHWDRFDDYTAHREGWIHRGLENADHSVIGWVDSKGDLYYATIPGGVDLDYFDFEEWIEDAEYG